MRARTILVRFDDVLDFILLYFVCIQHIISIGYFNAILTAQIILYIANWQNEKGELEKTTDSNSIIQQFQYINKYM